MIRIFLLAVSSAAILFSCGGGTAGGSAAEVIARPGMGGELRGVSIGDNAEKVLSVDPGESLYSMPDQIVYRLPLHEGGNTWYEINYNLSESGVYDISLEVFPQDSIECAQISADLLAMYISRYGPPRNERGFFTWKVMSEEDHIITVSLTDTLREKDKHIIRVHFTESN